MSTLYVGGRHIINRFGNLQAAVERAQDDDVIELFKNVDDAAIYINKNITINGNGHVITPAAGKSAFDCASFVTLNDIKFRCRPRTNAVIIRNGGNLSGIETRILGPARALYPTLVQRGGTLKLTGSQIMHMETYQSHGTGKSYTEIHDSQIMNYYGGFAYLNDDGYSLSKFRTKTIIHGSVITCALFENSCTLEDTELRNFNKVTGTAVLSSCRLNAQRGDIAGYAGEPADGPLKDLNRSVIPYALHIAGGSVEVKGFSCDTGRENIGFYMTSGSLSISSTRSYNDKARHLIKGGSVMFNDVTDEGFYEIRKARCGIVRSRVNTSSDAKSAMDSLDSMIGLHSVKKQLRTILNTIRVNMEYPEKDFGFSNHMVFAGDPGTGKTTVAKLVAQALFEIGAIPENKCTETTASRLIKGFIGQTGEHVESVLKKALGGVLFIDEAYELTVKDNQNTFNNDALGVLLHYMEEHRHELVVIVAGYEKEMREFLASNVGLTRRIQWISFENYTVDEMTDIFMTMSRQYTEVIDSVRPMTLLSENFHHLTQFYLTHPDAKGRITNGGNAGLVRNVFQQVVFARNNRVAGEAVPNMHITEDDICLGFGEEMKKAMNIMFGRA